MRKILEIIEDLGMITVMIMLMAGLLAFIIIIQLGIIRFLTNGDTIYIC